MHNWHSLLSAMQKHINFINLRPQMSGIEHLDNVLQFFFSPNKWGNAAMMQRFSISENKKFIYKYSCTPTGLKAKFRWL